MAHCEEDWEPEAIVGEQELVEEEDANVGGVPEDDEGGYEKRLLLGRHFYKNLAQNSKGAWI